mmetsp:Transcript_23546/g.80234  ORF Transcript_23546/g.80234 Transcript_23546/m.80234 type:complete len:215 (-) Transcript_23546:591-1235(-)
MFRRISFPSCGGGGWNASYIRVWSKTSSSLSLENAFSISSLMFLPSGLNAFSISAPTSTCLLWGVSNVNTPTGGSSPWSGRYKHIWSLCNSVSGCTPILVHSSLPVSGSTRPIPGIFVLPTAFSVFTSHPAMSSVSLTDSSLRLISLRSVNIPPMPLPSTTFSPNMRLTTVPLGHSSLGMTRSAKCAIGLSCSVTLNFFAACSCQLSNLLLRSS